MPHLLMKTKVFSLQRAKLYRHPENQSELMMWQAGLFCQNLISATQNVSQYLVLSPRACMHA